MKKVLFLDTNVFIECKSFTEISWRELFDNFIGDIIIYVPETVLEELDNLKKREGKTIKILSKIRDYIGIEFEPGIKLEISNIPPDWDSLQPEYKKLLSKHKTDHLIITEVLNYIDRNPKDDVIFVTGDTAPEIKARMFLTINTIFWRTPQYETIFLQKKTSKIIIPDLEITFHNKKKELNLKEDTSSLNKMKIPKYNIPDDLNAFEQLYYIENYGYSLVDLMKPSIDSIKSWCKSMDAEFREKYNPNIKTIEQFIKEIHEYNKKIENCRIIELYLHNNGNFPYNNVNIKIETTLEKSIAFWFKSSITRPLGPEILKEDKVEKQCVKGNEILKEESEKNNSWIIGYTVNKIQHNTILKMEPLILKTPKEIKTNRITYNSNFTHDQEGKIGDQRLVISIE